MNIKEKVLTQVQKNIEKYNMVSFGDTVCVGLSGGADSVTLLYCLNELKEKFNFSLIAAHINHGIRKEASCDEEFCKGLCEKLGIEFHSKQVKIKELAKENHLGEEEMGRVVRYGFFRELCGDGKIATAHNKNDNVETIFMRLIRGTGLNGLSGIGFTNGNIIRPLLNISRKDIEEFVVFCGLAHVTDKTNFQTIYTRNKIRLKVIPYIEENINKNVINTIGDNIEQYRQDADCLDEIAGNIFNSISFEKDNCIYINICDISGEHIAIQKRIIMKALSKVKGVYNDIASSKNLDDILSLLDKESGKSFEMGGIICKVLGENLVIYNKNNFKDNSCDISYEECFMEEDIVNNPYICYVPKEMFNESFSVRKKKDGDVVRVCDGVHKKLSAFLCDKKVPIEVRKDILVVTLNDEVIMIPHYFSTRFNNRKGEFVKISVK